MKTMPALDKLRLVGAIENGTVIDHIDQGQALLLSRLLKLETFGKQITIGLNLKSSRMGFKDIIKVESFALAAEEANRVAIFSSRATLNMIQNYEVIEKYSVKLPEAIDGFILCPNANCITNHEKVDSYFYVDAARKEIRLFCRYCERVFYQAELKLKL